MSPHTLTLATLHLATAIGGSRRTPATATARAAVLALAGEMNAWVARHCDGLNPDPAEAKALIERAKVAMAEFGRAARGGGEC